MIGIKGEIIVIDPADGELNDGSNGNEYLMPENKTLYAVCAEADE